MTGDLDRKGLNFFDSLDPGNFEINWIAKVPDELHPQLAEKLIEAGREQEVADNIGNFNRLSETTLEKLASKGRIVPALLSLGKINIKEEDVEEAGKKLAEAYATFKGREIEDKQEARPRFVGKHQPAHMDDIVEIFHTGYELEAIKRLVRENPEIFQTADKQKFYIILLLDSNFIIGVQFILDNIKDFRGFADQRLAEIVLKDEQGIFFTHFRTVLTNLNLFKIENYQQLVKAAAGNERNLWTVVRYIENFPPETHKSIAIILAQAGQGWYVVENWEKFSGFDQEVIIAVVKSGGLGPVTVADRIRNFPDFPCILNQDLANAFMEEGRIALLMSHLLIDYRTEPRTFIAYKERLKGASLTGDLKLLLLFLKIDAAEGYFTPQQIEELNEILEK